MNTQRQVESEFRVSLRWALVVAVVLGIAAGSATAVYYGEIGEAILKFVLQPGDGGVFLMLESPLTLVLFPVKLFVIAALSFASVAITAWFITRDRWAAILVFMLLLCSSLLLTGFSFVAYRQYMQEIVQVSVAGKPQPPRTRGQSIPLGAVPLLPLGLIGPVVVLAAALVVRRKSYRTAYAL